MDPIVPNEVANGHLRYHEPMETAVGAAGEKSIAPMIRYQLN